MKASSEVIDNIAEGDFDGDCNADGSHLAVQIYSIEMDRGAIDSFAGFSGGRIVREKLQN